MHRVLAALALLTAAALSPTHLQGQFIETRALSLEGAKQIMEAAEAEARRNNWNVAISIVDASGAQILFQRMDGVGPMSLDIAVGKAQTAARFRRPTRMIQEMIAGGNVAFLAVEGVLPLEGGIPIIVDGHALGGIGVSGVTAQQDAQVAEAGLRAILP